MLLEIEVYIESVKIHTSLLKFAQSYEKETKKNEQATKKLSLCHIGR